MESFRDPDEGYSEHPLSSDHTASEFAAWLTNHVSTLSEAEKTQIAIKILDELPTSILSDIVRRTVNPRLYIDFVQRLPTEICLKILGYLDPVSLVHVAQASRSWHNLALDGHLWENLFYLEGWRPIPSKIAAAEGRMNSGLATETVMQPQRTRSSEYGHSHKKRLISSPSPYGTDGDSMDVDRDEKQDGPDVEMSGSSLFGGPLPAGSTSSAKSTGSVVKQLGHLMMDSPSLMPQQGSRQSSVAPVDIKGKGKAVATAFGSPAPSPAWPSIPKSKLWVLDTQDRRYKINWQYLYTMRRRLEYNWLKEKYVTFQLPHPNFRHEGHVECVYTLQFNSKFLVSGSRDQTIRIWNMRTRRLVRPALVGHTGSVLCLQFDSDPEEDLIVSGGSDSDVILWRFSTGQIIQRLQKAHTESVLNVKFDSRILVTCSKDKTIKIFNRKDLRPGDLGYGDPSVVSPVPTNLKNYDLDDSALGQLPIKPAYSQIGCLEGHGAAVNAVQIWGKEIVSASGDRHIKVWDWPNQVCGRTFLGHSKGIACVQYDGRRIVSGSSDHEVKIFDRETGLEVASLRAHGNLVRTVQVGFGDLPYSAEVDPVTAQEVDQEYFKARDAGTVVNKRQAKERNAGSRRPEDITAYGAKLPPGGGGGPHARIVSGSYDHTVVIWRRDGEDGVWRPKTVLRQEEVVAAAMRGQAEANARTARTSLPTTLAGSSSAPSLHHNARPIVRLPLSTASASAAVPHPPYMQVEHPIHATVTPQTNASYAQLIDNVVPQGPVALRNALNSFPTMLAYQNRLRAAIDREQPWDLRVALRAEVQNARARTVIAQNRIQESVHQAMAGPSSSSMGASVPQVDLSAHNGGSSGPPTGPASVSLQAHSSQQPPAHQQHTSQFQAAGQAQPALAANAPVPAHHPHITQAAQVENNAAKIFKLQFDARRIICCSQAATIVGWDFCDDPELEEASRFFAPVE